MTAARELDARGLVCPLPVLKARKVLQGMAAGAVLKVSVTDDNAPADFKLFCAEAGHVLQDIRPNQNGFDIWLARG